MQKHAPVVLALTLATAALLAVSIGLNSGPRPADVERIQATPEYRAAAAHYQNQNR